MSVLVHTRPLRGLAIVGLAYVVALIAATAVVRALPGVDVLWAVAAADVAATVVVFGFSLATNNTSIYDPYWSVVPPVIAVYLAVSPTGASGDSLRQLAMVSLITLYGVRLTFNWVRGWGGLSHEDWRYRDLRGPSGRLYWVVSFFGLHLLPTVMVFLGSLPLFHAFASPLPFGVLDGVAAAVTLLAIGIETLADEQLRAFRRTAPAGAICDVGLWRFSRHPNYFGELMFWLGLALFGSAAGAPSWTWLGLIAMVALFLGISIPMAERRSMKRRPAYAEHRRRVSMLVPWFPARQAMNQAAPPGEA